MLLNYPIDHRVLLRKKSSIKKRLLENKNLIEKRVAILGGSTTAEIKNTLELFLLDRGIRPIFYESDYSKYYEDALFGSPNLEQFKPDIIYIHTTVVNITNFPKMSDSEEKIRALLNSEIDRYKSIWSALLKYDCAIIQNNFDYPIDRDLGNMDNYDIHGRIHYLNQLNLAFAENARDIKSLYINDINYLSSYIGLTRWFDRRLWYQAKYAVSLEAIPELSFNLAKIISAIFGKTKKCIVLDLDNTCWGGVIGDDGLDGIQIGKETAVAEAYSAFQEYIKRLKERGITLAVCSKNDFNNAKEGFSHPDSILKYEDFTSFKANWEPKYQNIVEIADEINIGLDSIVFIDDNPAERDIVSSQIPSVEVPDIGSDVVNFIDYIDKNGYFEPVTLSMEDINRNRYYEDNKKRLIEQSFYDSYDDFLHSLNMVAEIKPFSSIYLDRITQLTNKTNQFNLTTQRYTDAEIKHFASDDNYITLYGRLIDKYGDNGLISVVIGRIDGNVCHIELWLMSCRVLKRGMEFAMLDRLVQECKKRDIQEIIGYYLKTEKNSMVSNLYGEFGFELLEKSDNRTTWSLDISSYTNKNIFIEVNDE